MYIKTDFFTTTKHLSQGKTEMLNFHLSVVQQIAVLALQLGVIIFAAKFCGDLAKKLKMPAVLGELSAGILIGPYVLGGIGIPLHGLEDGLFAVMETVKVAGSGILGAAVFVYFVPILFFFFAFVLCSTGGLPEWAGIVISVAAFMLGAACVYVVNRYIRKDKAMEFNIVSVVEDICLDM